MGRVVASWRFLGRTPALADVVRELERRCGVPFTRGGSTASGAQTGSRWTALLVEAPAVCPGYVIDLARKEGLIEASARAPAHPYLWAQLDGAVKELAGSRPDGLTAWLPLRARSGLERPWSLLTWAQRLRLGRRAFSLLW